MTDKPQSPRDVLLAHIQARYGPEAKQQAKDIYAAASLRYSRYSRKYTAEQRLAAAEKNDRFYSPEAKQRVVDKFRAAAQRARAIYETGEQEDTQ